MPLPSTATNTPTSVPTNTPTATATATAATYTPTAIPYSYLPVGSFVLGDLSVAAALTSTTPLTLTWWGAQWAKDNTLSGAAAPNAFKGFAATLSSEPPSCGGTWMTTPGNSPSPPDSVPAYMAVVVASKVIKSDNTISGNVVKIIVVKTNPGYTPDPGHAGTGSVVEVLCQSPQGAGAGPDAHGRRLSVWDVMHAQ